MNQTIVYSDRALAVWDDVKFSRFAPATHAKLAMLKQENHVDYCTVLGLLFDIAIYRSDELPEGAQGPDPSEYIVTVRSEDLDSFPGELPVSHDPQALLVEVVERWNLEKRLEDALTYQQALSDAENSHSSMVVRDFSGIAIEGQAITVRLIPDADGLIRVRVIAHPALTNYSRSCTLGTEGAVTEFHYEEIQLDGDSLECMRVSTYGPIYREGFRVLLEPGMSDQIKEFLPLLKRVASVSAAVKKRYAQVIGETQYLHMTEFLSEVVAAIVLDCDSHDIALAKIKASHWAGQDEQLMAPFEDDQIRQLLITATN